MVTTSLNPGDVVEGLYEIVAPIARGGTAIVYAAKALDGSGRVAVKVLAVRNDDFEQVKRRFFRELVLATRVRHPNVVDLRDFGVLRQTGEPYLVMELLRGATLAAELRRHGPLPIARAAPLFMGVLEALAEAHAQGLVHQDLKPANLFLCRDRDRVESLVVLDFGIAHRLHEPEDTSGEWSATPRYAAPEYLRRREIGPSIDVYQVGLVLAEALSGRAAVPSEDAAECFRAHLSGRLQLPPEVMDGPLGPLIRRATSSDPALRFADAHEMLEALREAVPGAPPAVRSTPGAVRREAPTERVRRREIPRPTFPDQSQDLSEISASSEAPHLASSTVRTPHLPAVVHPRRTARGLEVAAAACALALSAGLVAGLLLGWFHL